VAIDVDHIFVLIELLYAGIDRVGSSRPYRHEVLLVLNSTLTPGVVVQVFRISILFWFKPRLQHARRLSTSHPTHHLLVGSGVHCALLITFLEIAPANSRVLFISLRSAVQNGVWHVLKQRRSH
jgi:hypothetical protein